MKGKNNASANILQIIGIFRLIFCLAEEKKQVKKIVCGIDKIQSISSFANTLLSENKSKYQSETLVNLLHAFQMSLLPPVYEAV